MVRYYSHFSADPYYNMAFDEWMFAKALSETGSRYLRLYTWDRPAITFGFHQQYERAIDHTRLENIPAIRRVTGGRALLHDPTELTYSIAINTGDNATDAPTGSTISISIAETLVEFLRNVDIDCILIRTSASQNSHPDFFHKAPCFASTARYEIVRGGQKIIASAQRRLEGTLFQHGSIKVSGAASHPALSLESSAARNLEELKPISKDIFRYMEQRFMSAFRRWLGDGEFISDMSESDQISMFERLKLVQKKCGLRRDIFKQK